MEEKEQDGSLFKLQVKCGLLKISVQVLIAINVFTLILLLLAISF